MNKVLSTTLVLAIILAALAFVSGPIWTFYDLRSASQSEDIASLSKLVNFDTVRTSLKTQLQAGDEGVSAPAPDVLNDPIGATGDLFKKTTKSVGDAITGMIHPEQAPKMIREITADPEPYLKPKALLALTYGAGRDAPEADIQMDSPPNITPKILYWSIDRARLNVKGRSGKKTVFTFERKGIFRWQLVHIGLPPKVTPKPNISPKTQVKPDNSVMVE